MTQHLLEAHINNTNFYQSSSKNMESMNQSIASCETHIDVKFPDKRRVSFSDQPNESITSSVPLLLQPAYARSKSFVYDELRNFRVTLKWCALDHTSCINKSLSYFAFVVFTVAIPIVSSFSIHVPATAIADDPLSINKLVHLPESGLALIAFLTLTRFLRLYGLRQLLFLDGLQDDSKYVRSGYTRELDKAFRCLVYILLPSFFIELAHKIVFFSDVTISIPHVKYGIPINSIMFIAVMASWIYRTGVFLLVCVFFRLTCELQILRLEGFKKLFEGCGSDAGMMFREHMRIRKQLSVTSHMYRFFIIMSLITITVSQFGALLVVLASKSEKSFFNSGDLVVCSAVQLSGFFLCLMGAARITHRAQGIVSIATRWNMQATCGSNSEFETSTTKTIMPAEADAMDSSDGCITICSKDTSSFGTRLALVTYLQHNNGGITLFGFPLDRGLLHTLFAFEFSLVLWILSKVVVLS
ncbi:Ras guanine nucleotide exchange factor k [Thalictrum thalictroides]|uniref:Ras guanine nucleotide exchange factor k n=1 Tax=Thalictrum thalictroides TaxID=46969 RepID=A0A7J6UUJ8_THATH|nr:Ras guanine nucleotide exchange factor k [Thalictrum thalictroides]